MSTQSHGELLGVIDWGIGGLGVVQAMRACGVTTSIAYVSDTGAVPYGRMAAAALAARVDDVIERLRVMGAERVLIACNAASTVIDRLHASVPISGVIEPALRCVPRSQHGTIGVIGGARTIRSGLYRRGLQQAQRRIVQRIAQPLSAHIEHGTWTQPDGQRDLRRILAPLRDVDALLLACTHYAAIAPAIQTYVPRASLFDPAATVAAELAPSLPPGDRQLAAYTTGDARAMQRAAEHTWSMTLDHVTPIRI